ncbi:hypothetical protein [Micromonospora sp. RTGN7]|uniref:hypothetical protein n=1 Tax=Micromonospora sp. RTGN7 TaxID=3016526 RepID=UPI0029FF3707|nr:hypothetical protein [Micromonospora sp. RTGN7]
MVLQRVLAVLLLLIAFVALALSHTFSFLDDLSELGETAVVVAGAVCGMAGVSLWFRKTSGQSSPQATGDGEPH